MDKKDYVSMIKKEYDDFRSDMLSKSKEEMFNNAYKIYFYENVSDYLMNANLGDEDITIGALWDIYIDGDYEPIGSWDSIYDFYRNACIRLGGYGNE